MAQSKRPRRTFTPEFKEQLELIKRRKQTQQLLMENDVFLFYLFYHDELIIHMHRKM